MRLNKN